MSAGELISVVVTCYNLEAYIAEAVASALGQPDAGPFEVIVVDDGSTDRSREILAGMSGIRLIELETNSGVMLATLAGTEAAQGDIVCYLDGDDIWEPGKLAAVRAAFADPAVALVTHDLSYADEGGQPIDRPTRPAQVLGQASERVREGILSLGDFVWLGSALAIRKGAARWTEFAEWVRQSPNSANLYQDWPLAWWIASLPDAKLTYIPDRLFRYRLHGANHSGDARTAERAARNYRRSFLTLSAIAELARERPHCAAFRSRIEARAALNRANMLAYQGRRLAALPSLLQAMPGHLSRKFEAVALIKAAVLIALGPRIVTRLRAQ